ncbi:AsmA family protein [Pseudovibrio axinellae]|uniref:AsmA family protein n=1 Tax=Pseudovibrio axinellae TaxID=989403 RepID=A0A166ARB5_9HYPH|nr:AsmA family protein [Pseudovibrio axinellae]KZL21457.1 AsmA family protein [Pseudovibrio axinellae]SER05991.1 AsmA family protein [Pseudovibrio axinellae]
MNSVYITVGGTLILALFIALVGPLVIDWSAYRSMFESYGEKILGHEVTILGETDVQLLPAPFVKLSDVRVGAVEDPLMTIKGFEGRIELPSLLRGEVHVTQMKLTEPELNLSLDEEGRLDVLQASSRRSVISELDPASLVLEAVSVVNGSVALTDARTGEVHQAKNANLELYAGGLQGPFKAEGALRYDGVPYTLKIGSGRLERGGQIRIKTQVYPANVAAQFTTDGFLKHENGVVSYTGDVEAQSVRSEGSEKLEWAGRSKFTVNGERLELTESTLRLGSEDRPITAEGGGVYQFGPERQFQAVAEFKQVDLDRMIGGGPQHPLVPATEVLARITGGLQGIPLLDVKGQMDLNVPVVVAGGSVVSNLSALLEATGTGWKIEELSGELPGGSQFQTSGYLNLSDSAGYQGDWEVASRQPHQLAHWWLGERKDASKRLTSVSLKGRVEAGSGALRLPDLRIDAGNVRSVGLISFEHPLDRSPLITVDMDSDRVNLDEIQRYVEAFTGKKIKPSAVDMSVRLYADELVASGVNAKSMAVSASLSEDALSIEQLKIRDFAGAYVDMKGRIDDLSTTPQGNIKGTLTASSLGGAVAVLEEYAPDNPLIERLKVAAPALAPAKLQAELTAYAEKGRTDMSLNLFGEVGVSDLDLNGTFEGRIDDFAEGDLYAEATLGGKDGVKVLRQLGFSAIPITQLHPGEVRLSVSGSPRDQLGFGFSSDLVGMKITSEGTVRVPQRSDAVWSADVALQSDDLAAYGLAFGKVYPIYAGPLTVNLSGKAAGTGRTFTLSDLKGQLANMILKSDLEGTWSKTGPVKASGKLELSELDMRSLSELLLGSNVWAGVLQQDSVWSSQALGQSLIDGVDLTLDVKSDRAVFSDEFRLDAASGQLRLRPDLLSVSKGAGRFAGGTFSGAFDLQRDQGQATLSGRFRLDDADFAELAWTDDGRALATGKLQAITEFEGSGRTISGLVAGLSGGGTFNLTDGEIRRVNPEAFDLVIKAADAGLELDGTAIQKTFADHLDAGSVKFNRVDGSLGIASGRIRARNISVDTAGTTLFGSALIDLEKWELNGDVSMKTRDEAQKVAGAEPQVAILYSGSLESPRRKLDTGPLLSYLNLRAIELNVQRIEEEQLRIAEQERMLDELKRKQEEETTRKAKAVQDAKESAARAEADEAARKAKALEALELAEDAQRASEAVTVESEQKTSVQDFGARIRSVLEGDASAKKSGSPSVSIVDPPKPKAKSDLPALDAPVLIGDVVETTVPSGEIDLLGPIIQSGAPKNLGIYDAGNDNQILEGPLQDLPAEGRGAPKFIELPGGRLLQVN